MVISFTESVHLSLHLNKITKKFKKKKKINRQRKHLKFYIDQNDELFPLH